MTSRFALMLPGGGARGAYQIGALRAVWEILQQSQNPFPIITGTSAGAINAAVLASHAHEFEVGIERLEHFWHSMFCGRIYRTGTKDALASTWQWIWALIFNKNRQQQPRSLLNNQPLANLLHKEFQSHGVVEAIRQGALQALSITASGYTSASAVSFFQGHAQIQQWERNRRLGKPAQIGAEHLLASAALPLLFPAQLIGHEYFGDGGIRQTAPLSPAVHLGASHILVIGTRDEHLDPTSQQSDSDYPSMGDIAGYMLDVIFMDNLQADLARLQRINRTLALLSPKARTQTHLRPIDTLVLKPSRDIREIAQRHTHRMPASVRYLLRAVGAWGHRSRLPSYLLFESEFCSELMELGYNDTMSQRHLVEHFFSVQRKASTDASTDNS